MRGGRPGSSRAVLWGAVVALALAAQACETERTCRSGTLFVHVDLGPFNKVNEVDISVSIDGATPMTTSLPIASGTHTGGIEIDFPHGYPAGKLVQIDVQSKVAGKPVALHTTTVRVAPGCQAIDFDFSNVDAVTGTGGAAGSSAGGRGGVAGTAAGGTSGAAGTSGTGGGGTGGVGGGATGGSIGGSTGGSGGLLAGRGGGGGTGGGGGGIGGSLAGRGGSGGGGTGGGGTGGIAGAGARGGSGGTSGTGGTCVPTGAENCFNGKDDDCDNHIDCDDTECGPVAQCVPLDAVGAKIGVVVTNGTACPTGFTDLTGILYGAHWRRLQRLLLPAADSHRLHDEYLELRHGGGLREREQPGHAGDRAQLDAGVHDAVVDRKHVRPGVRRPGEHVHAGHQRIVHAERRRDAGAEQLDDVPPVLRDGDGRRLPDDDSGLHSRHVVTEMHDVGRPAYLPDGDEPLHLLHELHRQPDLQHLLVRQPDRAGLLLDARQRRHRLHLLAERDRDAVERPALLLLGQRRLLAGRRVHGQPDAAHELPGELVDERHAVADRPEDRLLHVAADGASRKVSRLPTLPTLSRKGEREETQMWTTSPSAAAVASYMTSDSVGCGWTAASTSCAVASDVIASDISAIRSVTP